MSFIAAMDNSGGSAGGVLDTYEQVWNEEDKMQKVHEFRTRMLTSLNIDPNKEREIDTVIMYKDSVDRGMVDLCKDMKIEPYLKIDSGTEENGTMKLFDINEILDYAVKNDCTGTKMRSIVYDYYMIDPVLTQQFAIGKFISIRGLMPIIEPEVPINHPNKHDLEIRLRERLDFWLDTIDYKCILKLTIPDKVNYYDHFLNHRNVYRVVALSGGYSLKNACEKLTPNRMSASFSRALAEGLKYDMTDKDFGEHIRANARLINKAAQLLNASTQVRLTRMPYT